MSLWDSNFCLGFPTFKKKLLVWFKIIHWIAMINLYISGRWRVPETNEKIFILIISLD